MKIPFVGMKHSWGLFKTTGRFELLILLFKASCCPEIYSGLFLHPIEYHNFLAYMGIGLEINSGAYLFNIQFI